MTAQEIFKKLGEDKILEMVGKIEFSFGNVSMIVKQKDVVGNIIQEWLQGWFNKNAIEYALNPNSQMPPDFFLDPHDFTKNLLEVKAFNWNAKPAFDIADFRMYAEEIIFKPYVLNTDYLIFAYELNNLGVVTIKDFWLKKVRQISRCMENWALNLQIKRGIIHKIRPGIWYSRSRFPNFESLEDFLSAIENVIYQAQNFYAAENWRQNFINSYKNFYGIILNIPRWNDIAPKYYN